MILKQTEENLREYDEFIQSCEKCNFSQSKMWANLKDNWKNEIVVSRDENGKINGGMSILIRKVPLFKNTLMYAPRGPVCDIHDKKVLYELFDSTKELAKKYKAYVLKIDPDIKIDDEEFKSIVKEYGFKIQKPTKNFEGIQPRFVFRLDVENKTEDEIFAAFHNKTRYNVRVALKNNVTVTIGNRDDLKRFHEIMVETGARDEFVIRNLAYFEKMYDMMAPTDNLRLYLAHFEGNIVAGTIAIKYGDKVWYLYGASSNSSRNVMPNYLLQWEMIKWAIEEKCRIYDFRGVSGDLSEDNPLYGLYRFKKGFSGEFTEFIGDIDLVYSPIMKFAIDKGERIYRNLRRKVMLRKK